MAHLPNLIRDLALILISAGFVTVIFRRIRQPVVLGYLLAGLLVSPHVEFLPTVTDLPNIQVWAEIGVVFLLFALGLEFSFKKLFHVGGAALLTALVEVLGMTVIGYLAGKSFGWSTMDSIFLGGILSISSTTIIIRAIDELGFKHRGFVHLVFGILVVEDLIAILLLALLSTIARSGEIAGFDLLMPIGKLVFFTALWFIAGIFILPTLLKSMRRHTNEETLLIFSLGLCFAMVVLTTKAGFSAPLGAFLMGSTLAETNDAERIGHLVEPVKNLFAAIFFVSVGMLIDPQFLAEYWMPIALITILTISGKFLTTALGALMSGRNLRHSVQAGVSLAQIGEFSFIIATLGLSLKVTSDFLYPVAVGVSVVTTFTTPYLIRSADRVHRFIERHLPRRVRNSLAGYEASTRRVSASKEWTSVLKNYGVSTLANSVVIIAIFTATAYFFPPFARNVIADSRLVNLLGLAMAALISAPFFWALILGRSSGNPIRRLWRARENRPAIIGLETLRVLFGILLFGSLASQFIAVKMAAALTGGLLFLLLVAFARYLRAIHAWLETRFLYNLAERENMKDSSTSPLLPWDAHLARFEVAASADVVGKTLEELKVRERFGVSVALIERGQRVLTAPGRSARLFPGDRVSVIGGDEQIQAFAEFLNNKEFSNDHPGAESYALQAVPILPNMPFCGRSIRSSGIREKTDGLVVGLEREGQRILNPDSSIQIQPGDLLWIVGDRQKLRHLSLQD